MIDTTIPTLLREAAAPGVLLLRLNRPDKRNALATDLLAALSEALTNAEADPEIRCVVVTGGPSIFAAGADINELSEKDVAGAVADRRPAIWHRIRTFAKPLVAAVEGWCLGAGNELLMCCDLAIAGKSARFGQPETNLGIIPGAGGTATLPRLVGRTLAMRMVLLGDMIGAQEALEYGLIAEISEDGGALNRAIGMAMTIADRAPLAMRQGKARQWSLRRLTYRIPLICRWKDRFSRSSLDRLIDEKGLRHFVKSGSPSGKARSLDGMACRDALPRQQP